MRPPCRARPALAIDGKAEAGLPRSARRNGGDDRGLQQRKAHMLAQLSRAAMVRLWTAQLLPGTKSFERTRLIGSRRLNEYGLHVARVSLAHRIAASRRNRLAGLVSASDRQDF